MPPATAIQPVILSGGVGSRLWPLSRSTMPKQFMALAGVRTMIQETAQRVTGHQPPMVVCNAEQRFLVAEQLRAAGLANAGIVLEPAARGTAPAVAVAALRCAPDALLFIMPADHYVRKPEALAAAVKAAAPAAADGILVTFGIMPEGPETGYGYVCQGQPIEGRPGCYAVEHFKEKPDRATAEAYIAEGCYHWNSGMFLVQARAYLDELERLEPQMLAACRDAVAKGRSEGDFYFLDKEAFARARSDSIDYAVMERARRVAVVPVDLGWSDIGSWSAMWGLGEKDEDQNVRLGDTIAIGVHNALLRSHGPLVAAVGVDDLVVVATPDAVLVTNRDNAQDVKKIVEELERDGRSLTREHRKVERPWGSYETVARGAGFQVKEIIVRPGGRLSLQMHHKRAEHWTVVAGTAKVTRDDEVFTLNENESTFIPLGAKHRLENEGTVPLHLIEVQYGSYLGEDDIVRFADSYGRI